MPRERTKKGNTRGRARTAPPATSSRPDARSQALALAGVGICRYTFDGRVLFIDKGAMELFDLHGKFRRSEQVIGKNICDLFVHLAPHGELRSRMGPNHAAGRSEYHFRTLNGEEKWTLCETAVVKDAGTGENAVQLILVDITEWKRTEERLDRVMSGVRCVLWHAMVSRGRGRRMTWDIRVFNEAAAERLLPLKRARNQSYSAAWHKTTVREDRDRIDETSTQALLKGRTEYSQEYRCRRADGAVRWLSEDAHITPLAPNRWLVVGVCTDVTERRQMEESLRLSEERYRAIVELQTELIIRCTADGVITFANDAVLALFETTRDKVVGMNFLPLLPKDRRKKTKDQLRALTPEKPFALNENPTSIPGRPTRWFQWMNRGLFDADGNLIEILAVGRDITEHRLHEDHQQAIASGLRAVLLIADELISCTTLDDVYRRAVELCREKLRVDRCAVFLSEGPFMRGTYGTDRKGRTTDEHAHRFATMHEWLERFESALPDERRIIAFEQRYTEFRNGRAHTFGKGWVAFTPIRSGGRLLGIFSNDTAISGEPISETQQELVTVLCSLLGDIIERMRSEEKKEAVSRGLRAIVSVTDELLTCADLPSLYRLAVELARSALGVERCAIFMREGKCLRGTYGTDSRGRTTEEFSHVFPTTEEWDARLLRMREEGHRTLVVETPYHEWKNGEAVPFGFGWVAITPIQADREFVGIFCNDTAISAEPIDDTRQEIIAIYCSMIGALTERKRIEERQKVISEGLRAVVAITDELIACPNLDLFYRRAVELARARLGVERAAIFVRAGDELRGTYGTNCEGETTTEHRHVVDVSKEWIDHFESFAPAERQMVLREEPYTEWSRDRLRRFSRGWVAITPIQSAHRLVGAFSNDTAITRAPCDPIQQEIVSLYVSLLGALMERKQTEAKHASISQGLRIVVDAADELISCPDLDTVYRRAVELARAQLGMERCSIFIREEDGLRGTFGTNRKGEITDERSHILPPSREWIHKLESLHHKERRMIVVDQPYCEWVNGKEAHFSRGWVAITPIQSATEFIGFFCNDTGITNAPIDESRQEILAVFCSLLGAIIERKRTDDALRESERRFRETLSTVDLIALSLDLKGHITYCNEFLLHVTGWTRKDLIGTCWFDRFIPPDAVDGLARKYAKLVPTGAFPVRHENEIQTRGGQRRTISWSNTVLRDARGGIIGITSIGEDVTDRRLAEAEIRRLALVVEQEAEAVIISDTSGAIEYVNPAFERLSGYTRSDVLGKNPRILKSGRQNAEFYQKMWATLSSGSPWSGHLANRKRDGSIYEIEATISPIRNEAGDITNYVSTCRDVTHELQLEQQFRQAQKMEAVGRLAGGIAHDFNNLLTSILGYSRLVQEEIGEGSPLYSDIEEIVHAGERAAALTKQLLMFSRKQSIQPRPISLNAVVMDIDRLLRRTLGEDIELVTVLDGEMGYVNADSGLLEQVIMNLAINARDAMPKGGTLTIQTATVELDARFCAERVDLSPGRHCSLAVRDTGAGMTREVYERCFEPFFTTKEKGKGTGLGLSIVYSVVRQFGGVIDVGSAAGKGTSFTVYFPATEPPSEKEPPREKLELPRGTETILVVEDEDTVRRLAVRLLESLGYQVLQARHGGEAVLICEREKRPIQLLLTDVVMPHIGGQELVMRLLKIRKDFKVLYMSGFTDDTFVAKGIGNQEAPLLLKPFTNEALAIKVRQILDSR